MLSSPRREGHQQQHQYPVMTTSSSYLNSGNTAPTTLNTTAHYPMGRTLSSTSIASDDLNEITYGQRQKASKQVKQYILGEVLGEGRFYIDCVIFTIVINIK